jgi:maltooligosyltrehalose trehalohydrolase
MQAIEVSKRTLGVNFSDDGRATINIWAPEAKRVTVMAGGTQIPLEKSGKGYWQATSSQLTERTLYKIKLDDKDPLPDPTSLSQPEGVHGPSAAVNLASYPWNDKEWKNLPLEDYIIYELHTGTFTEEGNFASLEQKLGYLKELGINAIEIMPVAQFPGDRNWGYDGVFPFAVQHSYGGAAVCNVLWMPVHRQGSCSDTGRCVQSLGTRRKLFR